MSKQIRFINFVTNIFFSTVKLTYTEHMHL